jgi:hypothetical protein
VCLSVVFISRLKHELNPKLCLLKHPGSVVCTLIAEVAIFEYNILGGELKLAFQNVHSLCVYVTVNCGSELHDK